MHKLISTILLIYSFAMPTIAQEDIQQLYNVEILDLAGKPTAIPYWGEKNLVIFYIDPDRIGQNREFIDELERSKRAESCNIKSMGIINHHDAPFIPSKLIKSIAKRHTDRCGTMILSDKKATLSTEWNLGDCNNKFAIIMINKRGELIYQHKGIMSEQDQDNFYTTLESLKQNWGN